MSGDSQKEIDSSDPQKAIVLIGRASRALIEAKTIQEIHHLVGMAAAAQAYAKQVKASGEVVDQATELRIRAERRLGEMLAATPRAKGGKPHHKKESEEKNEPVPSGNRLAGSEEHEPEPTLDELGISRKESMRAQNLAGMPKDQFENVVTKAKEDGDLSVSRVVKSAQREQRKKDRREDGADFYPTPSWCVHRFLEAVELPSGRWLEPSVGDGSIIRSVNEVCDEQISWTSIDIRPECETVEHGDFLVGDFLELEKSMENYDVIITNPPYSKALEFAQAALKTAKVVVMLLRLNWLASADRCSFMRGNTPDVYVLPDRPSFDDEGTDATEYGWMVWGQNTEQHGRLWILETTPLDIRKPKA